MAACTPIPTETLFTTITTSSVSTSFTSSLTTLPPTTQTNVVTSCAATATVGGACLSEVLSTSFSTISGVVSTAQVPVPTTVLTTITQPTETRFSTCPSSTPSQTDSNPPTTPTPPPTSQSSSLTTQSTTFLSEASTTLPNGSVVQTSVVITTVLPPSYVTVPTMPGQTQQNTPGKKTAVAPIVGGVAGGLIGLIGIAALVWFILRRRSRWDDIFDRDYDDSMPVTAVRKSKSRRGRFDIGEDSSTAEPKPYHYGLVGQHASPPNSPPIQPVHSRTPSVAPLMLNAAPGSSTGASRPGSSGSQLGLPVGAAPPMPNVGTGAAGGAAAGAGANLLYTSSVGSALSSATGSTGRPGLGTTPHTSVLSSQSGGSASGGSFFVRAGSPTSPVDPTPRMPLHVANRPDSPTGTITSVSMYSDDTHANTSIAQQMSAMSPGGAAGGSGTAAGPSVAAAGSGSPNRRNEKSPRRASASAQPVVVHRDGGRVTEGPSAKTNTTPSDLPPPAYSPQ
ncbi:hypothetical protein BD410DRAFT_65872 [Rickenella mellea]|uniref:Mid2 domain-containing protein n=1 Tax=Rickenella mellea TaxID=50990 RepID=A0A4Y7QB36_9AGAM|nr:hypothetical protein BD410DRAFT_65872 [Rickenella mellea]